MKLYVLAKSSGVFLCEIMIKSKYALKSRSSDELILESVRKNLSTQKAEHVRVTPATRRCYTRYTFVFRSLHVRVTVIETKLFLLKYYFFLINLFIPSV